MRKYAQNATCGDRTRQLGPCGPGPYPTYKMVRGLNFLRAGAPAKFPDAIQAKGNPICLNRVCKNRPTFYRLLRERRPGGLFTPAKCFNFATLLGKRKYLPTESCVKHGSPFDRLKENGDHADCFPLEMF